MTVQRHRSQEWYVKPVDALRALLCLYIIVFHAHLLSFGDYRYAALSQGILAVNVFFVITGFGLMGSFLRHGGIREGVTSYVERRLIRVLPLYYACLAASFASVLLVKMPHDGSLLSPLTIVAHLLLLQIYLPEMGAYAINSTYWFIAVVVQLYVLFPFLATAWKRFGSVATSLVTLCATAALWFAFGGGSLFARPQFIFLLLCGMVAAAVVPRARLSPRRFAVGAFAVIVASILVLVALHVFVREAVPWSYAFLLRDVASGVLAAAVLAFVALPLPVPIARFLGHPAFGHLANISLAAYLTHDLVLRYVMVFVLMPLGFRGGVLFLALLAAALPVVYVLSLSMNALLEKPAARMAQ